MDKRQRISWLGNLERMVEDRMPKKIFTEEVEGTIRKRRPRKGWKEEVERDLQVLGVRRWKVGDIGKNGKMLFDRPKPTVGCSANVRRRRRRRPEENHEGYQPGQFNDRESNRAPPEYQSEALPLEPICQIIRLFVLLVTSVSCRMLTGCGVMDR
jgi:hypothetical protein